MSSDLNFYKNNGYLVKENLINQKIINKINKVVNEVVSKEKKKRKKNDINGTQSYDNYHFVYNSTSSKKKEILRLNNPQNRHKIFYELSRNKSIISIVKKLLGGSVRFHLGKLNFKLPNKKKGSEIGWHQDWAFYPHTNDNILEVGIFLDDCYEDNGPLMAVPGSHKGPIDDHHFKDNFIGAVDPSLSNYDISSAVPFLAKAGAVSFHHVRSLHGSKKNNSNKSRRVLFIGYAAADAWPLTGFRDLPLSPSTSQEDFKKVYTNNIVRGEPCLEARVEINPIKMPYPPSNSIGSIYENQKEVRGRSFGE